MKKIIVFIACLACFAAAQSQVRSADLLLTMTAPIEYDYVQTGKPQDFYVKLKNQGPNVINSTDTLLMTLRYDGDSVYSGGKPLQKYYFVTGGVFAVNDEVTVNFYTGLNQTFNTGGVHIYCIDIKLQNRSTTIGCSDPVLSNNTNCHHVYVTTFNNGVTDQHAALATINSIKAAPVPCSNTLNLAFSVKESADAKLVITDILGKEVLSAGNEFMTRGSHTRDLDVSMLPAGIYFASLNQNGAAVTVKFIKQ